MPTYYVPAIVPYVTEVCGFVEVEANSPEEAQEKALWPNLHGDFHYDPRYQDPGDASEMMLGATHVYGVTTDRVEAARVAEAGLIDVVKPMQNIQAILFERLFDQDRRKPTWKSE